MEGVLFAVIGSLATAVGHRAKDSRLLILTSIVAAACDVAATSLAPRILVAPLVSLVVVWHSILDKKWSTSTTLVAIGTFVVSRNAPVIVGMINTTTLSAISLLSFGLLLLRSTPLSVGFFSATSGLWLDVGIRLHPIGLSFVAIVAVVQLRELNSLLKTSENYSLVSSVYVASMVGFGATMSLLVYGKRPADLDAFASGVVMIVCGVWESFTPLKSSLSPLRS